MSEIWDLSTTDASNNDSSFGFPEGMNPSDVNDNLRRVLGAVARWYGDTNGALVSAGTGSAYTLASNRSLSTSYSDGQVFVFQANAASANGATLNVDGKGAKVILKRGTTTVSASDILADQIVAVAYEATNDKWQMLSPISGAGEPVGGSLQNVVEDTTPQLGGDLDLNGNAIDFPTTANISDVLDEDNMATDSATALATQQSIKAYVDSNKGKVVQVVASHDSAVATGTTTMTEDDTIPQNTEGNEFMTVSITPTSATNRLEIDVVLNGSSSSDDTQTVALFQDSTANALAAAFQQQNAANKAIQIFLKHEMAAGTTSATTFKVRAGGENAGTFTFNGVSGGRIFGGVMASSITVREIST